MESIQGLHQFFGPLRMKIEIPLKVPDRSNMFFHLIKNFFHETSVTNSGSQSSMVGNLLLALIFLPCTPSLKSRFSILLAS